MARTPISTIAQFAPCTINVRGKVTFSRLTSHISGQELEAQNKKIIARGGIAHTKPYITITIKNPVIVDNGKVPEQVKSVISERFFRMQDGTVVFTQESKSPFLPDVVYSLEAGELKGQGIANRDVPLQAELAKDLDVTIGVSLFKMKGVGVGAGLGINYVLINEPIQYYQNSSLASEFAAAGVTYVAPQAPAYSAPQAPAYSAPQQSQPAPNELFGASQQAQPYTPPISPSQVMQQPVNPYMTPAQPVQNTEAPQMPYFNQQAYQFNGQSMEATLGAQATAPSYNQTFTAPTPIPYDQPTFPGIGDDDIPFNTGSMSSPFGIEPTIQRPVR